MTGRDVIRALLQGEQPERLAWVPCIDPYTQSRSRAPTPPRASRR
jgi:hypothetical protein